MRTSSGIFHLARGERGESDLGTLMTVALLSIVISVVFTLQSCIKDFKDAKVERARDSQVLDQRTGVARSPGGYRLIFE